MRSLESNLLRMSSTDRKDISWLFKKSSSLEYRLFNDELDIDEFDEQFSVEINHNNTWW